VTIPVQDGSTAPVDAATTVLPVQPSTLQDSDAAAAQRARRAIIDAAKQILMSAHGMTEPEAYRWIQKSAMDSRAPMKVIATRIVDTSGAPVTAIAS
jgi:AmiR/NasT family two-component response regulator